MNSQQPLRFEPLSSAFADNPYATYSRLRSSPELHYFAPFDMWLVPWHHEVTLALRKPTMVRTLDHLLSEHALRERQVRDNWHDMPHHSRFVQFSLLDSDGPVHQRLRSQVFDAFRPSQIELLRAKCRGFIERRLADLSDRTEVDFIEDFAALVPGPTIGALMGVPEQDAKLLRLWSERIVQFFDIDRSNERKQIAEQATRDFYLYLLELRQDRRRNPRGDLLSQLVQLEAAGELTEDEFISTCMLIVMAGHGSTLDLLGSGLHCLLRFPDQLARLRENPTLLNTAVQEMFRFEPPLPFFHRYTTIDVTLRGQQFPAGTRFGLLYGSANRDELVFEEADQFDVARRPNPHRAFGGGAHFCLGVHLARLTAEIVFDGLLRRFRDIELLRQPDYKRGLAVRGPKALHIQLQPS